MSETKKLIKFLDEHMIKFASIVSDHIQGKAMLTEIKEIVEQNEPDEIIDGVKYCGRCLVGVKPSPSDEELVEKIIMEMDKIKAEIRSLLQSRLGGKDE